MKRELLITPILSIKNVKNVKKLTQVHTFDMYQSLSQGDLTLNLHL